MGFGPKPKEGILVIYVLTKLTSISINLTDPSSVHTYAGESNTFSEKMVNSTFSTPGQPAMATHAEGSFSKCPRYLTKRIGKGKLP